jgi:GNAT superfamily N-acetyltransferase
MRISQKNVPLTMVRDNLEGIPSYLLPAGYSIRGYLPGDEQHWRAIHLLADRYSTITTNLFAQEFGSEGALLAERQFYLLDAHQQAVGTASAWYDRDFWGRAYGRVHWVAIVPEHQGQGLAKPLMAVVCHRLRALGHGRAYLQTSSARVPAIGLYLQFGFIPQTRTARDVDVWRKLEKELGSALSPGQGLTASPRSGIQR